jgi:hypothetical protein
MTDLDHIVWAVMFGFAATLAWDGWRQHIATRSAQLHQEVADELLLRMANLEAKLTAELKAATKLYERRNPDA